MADLKDDQDKAHFVHKAWYSSTPLQGHITAAEKHFLLPTGIEIDSPHADNPEFLNF